MIDENMESHDLKAEEVEEMKQKSLMAEQLAAWEKRIERRTDPPPIEVPPDPPAEKALGPTQEEAPMVYKKADKVMMNQTVYLMLGTSMGPNGQVCPILFTEPYRVAGSRQNGKLILKPAKVDPIQRKA